MSFNHKKYQPLFYKESNSVQIFLLMMGLLYQQKDQGLKKQLMNMGQEEVI